MSLALFIQIQTLPPSMHQKWKEIFEIVCKKKPIEVAGDQLPNPSKSPIELEDNSIASNSACDFRNFFFFSLSECDEGSKNTY